MEKVFYGLVREWAMKEIVVGRDESDRQRFGDTGLSYLAKHYVTTGDKTNLANKVMMDFARPHVVFICGKRGQGKSYTLGVMAEEMTLLEPKLRKRLASVIFDTMGIYWSMKFPNERGEPLLKEWDLEPRAVDTNVVVPFGFVDQYREWGVPVDETFALKASELTASDWCATFGIDLFDKMGILIDRVVKKLKEGSGDYSFDDFVDAVGQDERADVSVRDAVENRLMAAEDWGLFHRKGTSLSKIIQAGKVNVLDISVYGGAIGGWSTRSLVVGLIVKRAFEARMMARRMEEMGAIKTAQSEFQTEEKLYKEAVEKMPMTWFYLDEAHEMMPRTGSTPALAPLVQLIREGRQPGLTLVAATQQPGKIHTDMMSQTDLVVSHRVTSVPDMGALNNIMGTYMRFNLENYLASLPREKGAAILLDDNSEKVYPIRMRPRLSWHGGESATLLRSHEQETVEGVG